MGLQVQYNGEVKQGLNMALNMHSRTDVDNSVVYIDRLHMKESLITQRRQNRQVLRRTAGEFYWDQLSWSQSAADQASLDALAPRKPHVSATLHPYSNDNICIRYTWQRTGQLLRIIWLNSHPIVACTNTSAKTSVSGEADYASIRRSSDSEDRSSWMFIRVVRGRPSSRFQFSAGG